MIRSTTRRRVAFAAASIAALGLLLPPSAAGAAETKTAKIGNSSEAWYSPVSFSTCALPAGCAPPAPAPAPASPPTSPYPADTLHVGFAAGSETARTYVLPDFYSLPFDATVTAGTLTMPLATEPEAGNMTPDVAKILACLATKPVPDGTQGSSDPPPEIDCKVSAPATYKADQGGSFSVDLAPFIAAWTGGATRNGIALIPDTAKSQPTDIWHVAFNGRKREGVQTASSEVTYTITEQDFGLPFEPPPVLTVPLPPVMNLPLPLPVPLPSATPEQPPVQQPPQTPVAYHGFQYPLAFLLPLLLLAGFLFLSRLFTGDATPMELRS